MVKKVKEKKSKRESTHKKNSPKPTRYRNYIVIFIALVVIPILSISAYLYMDAYQQQQQLKQKQQTSSDELMRKMKQMLDDEKTRLASMPALPPEVVSPKVEQNATQEVVLESNITTEESIVDKTLPEENMKTHELSEAKDYAANLKDANMTAVPKKPSEVIRKKYPEGTTPKLAIIIDDVSFPWQTRMMKEIPYKVTPAFFPPTSGHPETVRLSHEFTFAMVHLPLEARGYKHPEEDTLVTSDSVEVIEKRIKRIKKWFPHIRYYNNHTGGTFTAHYQAMNKLLATFRNENLIFVDSRTAPDSKAPVIFREHKMQLLSRDVFLDNSLNKAEITEQLKKAVQSARKHGYAIAIGHPHKNTLEVLRDSKELLRGIDLVYVNEL